MATFVSRCWYGYSCIEIAETLGYNSVSSVSRSVRYVQANVRRHGKTLRAIEEKEESIEQNS
ncbi:MAG: hypothetical protein JXM79_00925 [Sedimentisphaerales bacterium]|nr:hypothetical protein [Sedimentisphaerales bacterium]